MKVGLCKKTMSTSQQDIETLKSMGRYGEREGKWSYAIREMGNYDRKLWSGFERDKEAYRVKYTGEEATSEKSYTRDQETAFVCRLLL